MRVYPRSELLLGLLIILAISATRAVAAPAPTINLWCVGSPFTRDVPGTCAYPLIEQQAQRIGYPIAIQRIPAVEFVARFRNAVEEKRAPEILMFNNFGILTGVQTPAGRFEGLLEKDNAMAALLVMVYETMTPWQAGGWWTMLVVPAANYDAAKEMALQPLPCPVQSDSLRLPRSELSTVSDLAAQVGRAYLIGDNASLAAASDESRLGNKSFLPETNVILEKLQVCGVYGNEQLAFVALAGTFFTNRRTPPNRNIDYAQWLTNAPLGQQSLLTVFRKHEGQWRLLAISDDPANTGYSARATAVALARLSGLMTTDYETNSDKARLVTPDRAKVTPPPNLRFGNFEWISSPDATVVCEVAEFLVKDEASMRERTRLFFLFGREQRLSAGILWGKGGQWRVWSITRSGDVALSESRAYTTH
jgi:hypothetical protein